MSSKAILVRLPIWKSSDKLVKGDMVPLILCHPMHCPHIFCLLYEQGIIELSYDLYVLVIINTYELLNMMTLTCSDALIAYGILLLFHVVPINALCFWHNSPPFHNHSLIEILLKPCVKPVVRSIPMLWSWINLPKPLYLLCCPFPSIACDMVAQGLVRPSNGWTRVERNPSSRSGIEGPFNHLLLL
jgi:hypothetical protein